MIPDTTTKNFLINRGGMLLKTYDSDIFNNWVKTDWIDGVGGAASTDYKLPKTGLNVTPKNTDNVTIAIPSNVNNYKDAWSSIVFAIRDNTTGNGTQVTANQLTTDATKGTITLDKFNTLYPKGGN